MSETCKVDTLSDEASVILETIRGFLATTAPKAFEGAIDENTPLLGSGALDSLGILQLAMFLGDELKIEIDDDDFQQEHFETVGSLLRLVLRKKQLAA